MKVTIDRPACVSCGSCWDSCPEFFEENQEDSFSQVVEKFRSGKNPAEGISSKDLDDCVTGAAELCPVQIIRVEES